jgi:hypothetical protein
MSRGARLLLAGLLLLPVANAYALRCGGRVVSEGDSSLRLREYCGNPAQIEQREERVEVERYDSLHQRYYREQQVKPYEIWIYNFGPQRLINRIEVRDGVIKRITTGGYGY